MEFCRNVIFVILFLFSFSLAQQCSNQDYVILSGNQIVFSASNYGASIQVPFVVSYNASAPPTLVQEDSLIVQGGLRFVPSGNPPPCQYRNHGALWYRQQVGASDQILLCAKLDGPATRFHWKVLKSSGAYGKTNGPEVVDQYGATWDGYSRAPQTWTQASSICNSLGGRLPTLTELFRNNQQNLISGPISNYYAAPNPLWTSTVDDSQVNYYYVNMFNGALGSAAPTSSNRFRCIWPYEPVVPYTGTNCYGTPTQNCQTVGVFYNSDVLARPQVGFNSASYECHQHGGSLPTLNDIQSWAVQPSISLPGTVIVLNELASGGLKLTVSLSGYGPNWIYGPSYQTESTPTNFICMGKKPETPAYYNSGAPCYGSCFVATTRIRAPVVADMQPRPPATFEEAVFNCSQLGGKLPDWSIITDLMEQGWFQNSTAWHWTIKVDLNNVPGNILAFTAGSGTAPWSPSSFTVSSFSQNALLNYRCVWTSAVLSAPVDCGNYLSPNWASNFTYECLTNVPAANYTQNFYPNNSSPFIDSYGYGWDVASRPSATFLEAQTICESVGARLPTIGEIFRVSTTNNPTGSSITLPGNEPSIPLWTFLFDSSQNMRVTMTQGGVVGYFLDNNPQRYRCVWPPVPFGNSFGSHKCFGAPSDTDRCFRVGHWIFDRFDRPVVAAMVAAQECNFLGGRLPSFGELQSLIHNGAPWGYNGFVFGNPSAPSPYGLWVLEPGIPYYLAARWSQTGTSSWVPVFGTSWSLNNITISYSQPQNGFRCLFSDEL